MSNARLKSKHPVLLKVAIKTLFTPSSNKVCFAIQMIYYSNSHSKQLKVLFLILCSLLGNNRYLTEYQMERSVPIF